MSVLKLENITMEFGGLKAINDLSFEIEEGTIHGLIGPNGSGKTTTFNVISGVLVPTSGRVIFNSEDITQTKAYRIVKKGISRTFQHISLFNEMSVIENTMMGKHCRTHAGLFSSAIKTKRTRKEENATREEAYALLEFVGLEEKAQEKAKNLSYGDQRLFGDYPCTVKRAKPYYA